MSPSSSYHESAVMGSCSHIDRLIIGYGKGNPCMIADPAVVLDLIPGNMVANAMVVVSVLHANQPSQYICHVSTSFRKPLKTLKLRDYRYEYFSRNSWINEQGKPIKVTMPVILSSMERFRVYISILYLPI
ncbi:hypothetical protein GIB67_012901 [Kingdonia uniflora]|uniref:Fatty acyl-CoA reductase n=1 Tax=Kingdonia uniflora TaxID=39325 RepID=A0A7J7NG50_9MAGN|nr:hypothetical protein GIB67_012901 [Kingdonia uniflora]